MIKSFAYPETEKIWKGSKSPKLPPEIHKRAFAKLLIGQISSFVKSAKSGRNHC